jgi:phosphomevalonate kinase
MGGRQRTSAPGKLVLMGEYAVLRGQEAIVAAVDVRACAQLVLTEQLQVERDPGGLVEACLHELRDWGGEPRGHLEVDTSAFRDGSGQKLGLGSSAAACVAALYALSDAAGVVLSNRDALHSLAQRAHRRFQQGRGSGIDVAAAVYGGLVRFRRCEDTITVGSAPPLPLDWTLVPLWTGRAQDTRDFVAAVLALRCIDDVLAPLADAARSFVDACTRGQGDCAAQAMSAACRGLAALGEQAGIGIVTAPHRLAAAIAAEHGGAAKPSGAGGGDIALALVPAPRAAAFRAAATAAGLSPLSCAVGMGVRGADLETTTEPTAASRTGR